MITTLSINNYGCVRAIELGLSPLHVLVGPNDAGKSTLLRAMRTIAQFASGSFTDDGTGPKPFDPWLPPSEAFALPLPWLGAHTPRGSYHLSCDQGKLTEAFEAPVFGPASTNRLLKKPSNSTTNENYAPVLREIGPARLLRLDPDALRRPTPIVREGQPIDFADDRGTGLASVLQVMNGHDVDRFVELQRRAREQFPALQRLQLGFDGAATPNVLLRATLTDGTSIDASRFGEGLLYFLAFAALEFLAPAPLVLVESPEQGLHPARVRHVIAALRALHQATGTQIVMATQSPLVIDEMRPEEVTVVTRPNHERGTVVTPLERTPAFARRDASQGLGRLWAAGANGVDERGLLTGEV
jgi:predicted ATPase